MKWHWRNPTESVFEKICERALFEEHFLGRRRSKEQMKPGWLIKQLSETERELLTKLTADMTQHRQI